MDSARKRFTTEEILPANTQVAQQTSVQPQQVQPVPQPAPQAVAPTSPQPTQPTYAPLPPVGSSVVIKRENALRAISWKFVIPAIIIVFGIMIAGIFVPRLLQPAPAEVPVTPVPTLVPATPTPAPDLLPRAKEYLNVDKNMSFEYLSSFTIVECEQSVIFLRAKPENIDEVCAQEHPGVFEIWTNDIAVPFEGVDDVRYDIKEETGRYRFVFALLDQQYTLLFDRVFSTFQYIDPNLTEGWETYTSELGYRVQYPPEWILLPAEERTNTAVTDIRKTVESSKMNNWAIKYTNVSDASVSASEIMSSLQNLSGWKVRPTIEFRILDGEVAQILQGEYENAWQTNVVVWKETSLVEMTWVDQVHQPERLNFEAMLSSFEFTD